MALHFMSGHNEKGEKREESNISPPPDNQNNPNL